MKKSVSYVFLLLLSLVLICACKEEVFSGHIPPNKYAEPNNSSMIGKEVTFHWMDKQGKEVQYEVFYPEYDNYSLDVRNINKIKIPGYNNGEYVGFVSYGVESSDIYKVEEFDNTIYPLSDDTDVYLYMEDHSELSKKLNELLKEVSGVKHDLIEGNGYINDPYLISCTHDLFMLSSELLDGYTVHFFISDPKADGLSTDALRIRTLDNTKIELIDDSGNSQENIDYSLLPPNGIQVGNVDYTKPTKILIDLYGSTINCDDDGFVIVAGDAPLEVQIMNYSGTSQSRFEAAGTAIYVMGEKAHVKLLGNTLYSNTLLYTEPVENEDYDDVYYSGLMYDFGSSNLLSIARDTSSGITSSGKDVDAWKISKPLFKVVEGLLEADLIKEPEWKGPNGEYLDKMGLCKTLDGGRYVRKW